MTAPFVSVFPGAVIDAGAEKFLVLQFAGADQVLARRLSDDLVRTLSFAEIEGSSIREGNGSLPESRRDLSTISEEEREDALNVYKIIRPLLETTSRTAQMAQEAADLAGVNRATVYRWLRRFEETGTLTSLMHKRRTDAGKKRLPDTTEALIDATIKAEYLTKQHARIRHAYRKLKNALISQNLPVIHYNTFRRRIHALAPENVALCREGENAALRYRPNTGKIPNADHPYALIQIDHTPVDLILVDAVHRTPIGRPWITLAIDVFSRMVAGWYVSLDPPGDLSTGICISNVILSKQELVANLGLGFPWPCQGKPSVIHADNAKEFRGKMLENACQEHLIDLQFRKLRKPRYGAHIETYLGTLGERIHTLPGTTFSNPQQRGEYESVREAAMTLPEFEQWLGNLILGEYHHDIHGALGMPPIERYRQGIVGDGSRIGVGHIPIAKEPNLLRIDFLPLEERTVQAYGIQIDNICYYSDILRR
ncbi:DDE-type integrase/transposase/recombinase, partial [Rhodocyclus tenuis]